MKKWMIVMTSLVLSVPAFAQYGRPSYYGEQSRGRAMVQHEVYYGLRLGVGFATVNADDKKLDGGSLKAGLDVGAVIGVQLGYRSPLFFEAGLLYIEKGGKGSLDGKKFTYSLDYMELPLVLKYRIDMDGMFSIQPFLGGYIALGVGGKIKDFGNRAAYSSFDDDAFKRFDGGIRIGCGVQYDFLYAELGYDFGLANISHDYFDSSHTGTLFATIGANF